MTPATVLRVLDEGLRPAVEAIGGDLHIATDPEDVIEIICAAAPRGWRLILAYGGEQAVDVDQAPGIHDLTITTTVQAATSFQLRSGQHTFRPTPAGRSALLDLAHQVDLWFTGFTGTVAGDILCNGFRRTSRDWLAIENQPTRQLLASYRLRIGCGPDVPGTLDQIHLNWPIPS
ncbi:hypothetical protein HNR46_001339 [Haloferula luteola]|uniref:Uncharacterized protein n=1 Tax=Haloferula luteola TaxID=595692 RepID=A0A840UZD4_9BACT|nr:hypothetical protein [Haloferula luteola]MBB5351105.1 hypothetical protein [Haloferula luteola]